MKRAFSLFLALAMLFSLASCSQQEPETSPTGSQSQAASYTGTARGYGGDISVTIEVADGVITASRLISRIVCASATGAADASSFRNTSAAAGNTSIFSATIR